MNSIVALENKAPIIPDPPTPFLTRNKAYLPCGYVIVFDNGALSPNAADRLHIQELWFQQRITIYSIQGSILPLKR